MTRLPELLDEAIGPVAFDFGVDDIAPRVERRRRRRRVGVVSGVVAIAVLTTFVVSAVRGGRTSAPDVAVHPTLPADVSDVLVFDDAGGVLTVDLTGRVATHRPIDGWRPGDQPFMSLRVGDAFVVGWDDVYAFPIDGGASRKLGTGVFVAATETGDVWLTSYGQVQTRTERLVDMRGNVILEGPVPKGGALTGIPGGLVMQTETGLDIWDARTGRITRHLGTSSATAAPAFGSLLAWCDQCSRALHLTDLTSGVTRSVMPSIIPGMYGYYLTMDRVIFSPDGKTLAIPVWPNGDAPTAAAAKVITVDVATATVTSEIDTGGHYASLAWSPDGERVYIAATDDGRGGELLVHDRSTNTTRELGPLVAGAGNLSSVMRRVDYARMPAPAAGPAGNCRPVGPANESDVNGRLCHFGL